MSANYLPDRGTVERVKWDAFYGGVCCALAAAFYLGDGTDVGYLEVVGSVGPRELLNYARREDDPQLGNLRRAVRRIEERAFRFDQRGRA